MTIYIVEGSTGEYSDHREWPVVAYKSDAMAAEHVVDAQRRAGELLAANPYYGDIKGEDNEFDPHMLIDYTGVHYRFYAIELRTTRAK